MRYFINTSAGRPVVASGMTFDFELVGHGGGSWVGILAVDDSAASALLALNSPTIGEITEESYNSQKKKTPQPSQSSANSVLPWPTPRPLQGMAVAERVGSLTPPLQDSKIAAVIESATLKSAEINPPEEELLKEVVKPKSRPQPVAA